MSNWQQRYKRLLFDRPRTPRCCASTHEPPRETERHGCDHGTARSPIVWRDIDGDDTLTAVILQGARRQGPSRPAADFDIIEKNITDYNALLRTWKEARDIVYNVINCSKPIVSAIRGPAVGAGLVAGLLADVSIASKKAKIIDGHTRLGVRRRRSPFPVIIWAATLCGMAKAKY